MRPSVVYWNNFPSHYFAGRLNAVEQRGAVHVEAWFNSRRPGDRKWEVQERDWLFPYRYLPSVDVRGRLFSDPRSDLQRAQPDLLVSLYAEPSFAMGTMMAKSYGIRTAFRVLPTFDTWVQRSATKEAAKQFLFGTVDSVKVSGERGAEQALKYGVPADRICKVTQSIDVEHYRRATQMDPAVRARERERRGLHGCVFIYVGRLWRGKGLDTLLDAYQLVLERTRDVTLLLVGDGTDEAYYRSRALSLPSVVFAGFVPPAALPEIYALADVFVFPTLGDPHGLVVEEAMAAGLPVISSEAAGDIQTRLPEGQAGFVVRPGDPEELANRMLVLANDPEKRQAFSSRAQEEVVDRSHEHYAVDFERFVEQTLRLAPRNNTATHVAKAAGYLLRGVLPYAGTEQSEPVPAIALGEDQVEHTR